MIIIIIMYKNNTERDVVMLERLNHMKMKNKLNFGYRVVIGLMIISAIFSMIGMGIIYGSLQNYAT